MNNLLNIIVCLSIFLTTSLNSVVIAQTTTEGTEHAVVTTDENNTLANNKNTQVPNGELEDGSKYTLPTFAPDQNNN